MLQRFRAARAVILRPSCDLVVSLLTALVREVEAGHGIAVEFVQAAASSVLAAGLPDAPNTIAPGHLMTGGASITDKDVARDASSARRAART